MQEFDGASGRLGREAMRAAVERLGPDLDYLPDGDRWWSPAPPPRPARLADLLARRTSAALAALDRIKLLLADEPTA